ncbi:HNH endonuclease family protein [Staphylococcus equorum]
MSDFGFVDKEEFDKYINRLGNLTLLYSDENTSAGIQSVSDKKNIYQNSDFILTKSMVENIETGIKNGKETKRLNKINNFEPTYELSELWTKDMIEKRGENLAKLIIDSVKI